MRKDVAIAVKPIRFPLASFQSSLRFVAIQLRVVPFPFWVVAVAPGTVAIGLEEGPLGIRGIPFAIWVVA